MLMTRIIAGQDFDLMTATNFVHPRGYWTIVPQGANRFIYTWRTSYRAAAEQRNQYNRVNPLANATVCCVRTDQMIGPRIYLCTD